jgi:hypothetical protein
MTRPASTFRNNFDPRVAKADHWCQQIEASGQEGHHEAKILTEQPERQQAADQNLV